MPVVLVFKTNGQTVEYPILSRSVVGRSSSADLKIEDKQMSGKHGAFEVDLKGELIYTDLGSTNGSFLNNSAIQKTTVKINDVIKMGNTLVRIDEKKLNSKEKMAIGQSEINHEISLKVEASNQNNSFVRGAHAINEDLKSKDNGKGQNKRHELEQEVSSGQTKMLKLDKKPDKKKK